MYILFIGLQVQNKSICQSSFYVGREIRDKQSKSKTLPLNFLTLSKRRCASPPIRTTGLNELMTFVVRY